jgi:hypothetical protein
MRSVGKSRHHQNQMQAFQGLSIIEKKIFKMGIYERFERFIVEIK